MNWRAKLLSLILFVPALLSMGADALAQESGKRLALIVGMTNYVAAGTLPNAVRDAEAFDAFLKGQGFETDLILNVDRRGLAGALSSFSRKIRPEDVALFYYAGHGMQLHGENFLIGTDAKLESEFDVPGETMALSEIISALEKRARISLVFLDACRNNPLADRLNREVEGASRGGVTRGLAPIETQGAGTLVAFAAAPGQVAADGTGGNSPFTRALIANLSGPGLEVGTAFKRVVRDVRKETQGKQQPQILSSLSLEFYFGPETAAPQTPQAVQPVPTVPATDPAALEAEMDFKKALRIGTPRVWRFFIAKHLNGEYVALARQTLAQLEPLPPITGFPTSETAENQLLRTTQMRRSIQLALAGKGIEVGVADGVFGNQTRAAIRKFQSGNGMAANGFINVQTARALGIDVMQPSEGIYSTTQARRYQTEDLRGLETDERVLRAMACLPIHPTVYGVFQGHLYVAVLQPYLSFSNAQIAASTCGAHLATISSEAENEFVASLFNSDERFFDTGYDAGGNITFKFGPWIGLRQSPDGREPRSGWGWDNGEAMTYSNWLRDMPNESKKDDDFGLYYTHRDGRVDVKSLKVTTWDDMGPTNTTNSFIIEFE